MKGKGRRRVGSLFSSREYLCYLHYAKNLFEFHSSQVVFMLAWLGKGTELICIQSRGPFHCHPHKDGGARRVERRRGRNRFQRGQNRRGEQMRKEKEALNFFLSKE